MALVEDGLLRICTVQVLSRAPVPFSGLKEVRAKSHKEVFAGQAGDTVSLKAISPAVQKEAMTLWVVFREML
jgi:hypothetical protein